MKRIILIIIAILFSISSACAQAIHDYDTIINMKYYKAYYSHKIQSTSFVIYKLWHGGGDTNRANYSFKEYKNLKHFEYYLSGYDRGHLVPAEDLADTNLKLFSTFYYINCIPQSPSLNRGLWKRYENRVRQLSQNDPLLIICGGSDFSRKKSEIGIPKTCFKVVYSLSTHECLMVVLFANDDSRYIEEDNKRLKKKFTYRTIMNLYNKTSK